jgi:hypothetical protein
MIGSILKGVANDPKRRVVDKQWETDHNGAYAKAQLEWPPTFTEEFIEKTAHLSPRLCEVIWYWEQVATREQLTDAYVDIHMSINYGRGMVREMTPCIVSSSRIWGFSRTVDSDDFPAHDGGGMELSGHELLSLQGFGWSGQNRDFVDKVAAQEFRPTKALLHS